MSSVQFFDEACYNMRTHVCYFVQSGTGIICNFNTQLVKRILLQHIASMVPSNRYSMSNYYSNTGIPTMLTLFTVHLWRVIKYKISHK